MTILKNSQLGAVAVQANATTNILKASQLGLISVSSPPVAAALECSQLGVIIVMANNRQVLSLGPVFGLGCWNPCGNLAHLYREPM